MIFRTILQWLCPLGFLTLHVMKNSAPNMDGANQAALEQVQLSKESLAWAQQIYEETAPEREAAAARAAEVSDAELEMMRTATAQAKDIQDYQSRVFRPIEESIARDAMNFDTEARREEAAGKAVADVTGSFAAQRDATMRGMTRSGFAPTSSTVAAMRGMMDSEEALGRVAAAENAREQVGTVGRALKADAANLGRGIASSQATQAGLALNAGNASAGNMGQASNAAMSGAGIVQSGYGQALTGMQGAANTFTNIANIQQRAGDNSGLLGGLGNIAGRVMAAKFGM